MGGLSSLRLVLAATAALLAVPAAPSSAAPAKVRLLACEAAIEQSERFAVFEGEVRSIAGAARMQVRFALEAHTQDRAGWTRVAAPGFGTWVASSPGVRRFVYTKRVENLFAPARYRVVARFRWLDSAGEVIARDKRRSPVCRQPDQRANLLPLRIEVGPGAFPESQRYVIPIVNRGRVDAAGFAVRLTVDGEPQPIAMAAGLAAGERSALTLEGPRCRPGTTVSAVVDADGVIDEADEADNLVSVSCPSEA